MKILPTTTLGKWSLWLIEGFFVLLFLTTTVIVGFFRQEGGNTFTDNLFISIPMLSAFGLAFAAFITGIVSVWKYQERSLLIYVPIVLGILVSVFIIGELSMAQQSSNLDTYAFCYT